MTDGTIRTICIAAVCAIVAAGIAAAYFFGRRDGRRAAESATTTHIIRDTLVRTDTVILEKPVPVAQRIVDTLRVPFAVHDTTFVVTLPKTVREYRDSTYHAVISGYEPNLDRIEVFQKTVTISTIETRLKEASKWSFGVGVGPTVGYGFTPAGAQPFLGVGMTVGVQYRF